MFRRLIALSLLAGACLALSARPAKAQESGIPPGVRPEMLHWIRDAHDKLVELAEAIPADKYAWKPVEGVRTAGQVFMHVASANFGIPIFTGVQPPDGFDFRTFEASATTKEAVIGKLKESFVHAEKAFEGVAAADLDRPVDLFGTKTTVRGAYLMILTHAHEHLGQSIAYARSVGVTPPWTAREQAPPPAKDGK